MPKVKIPPVLRAQTGGESVVEVAGGDVGTVLNGLADLHPGVSSQLFDDAGELNRYVNVYLNDEDVRLLDGLATGVSEADTVVILPAMAGGCGRP
jgi:sulfur-carrier protein